MGVGGDEWHLVRVAFAQLKNGADLVTSKEVSSMVFSKHWTWWRLFEKANFMSWTGMSMTHAGALKSRLPSALESLACVVGGHLPTPLDF